MAQVDFRNVSLDAAAVAWVEPFGDKTRVAFEPAPPEKVRGASGLYCSVDVMGGYEEVLQAIENARFDAWLEHGGPQPEELRR